MLRYALVRLHRLPPDIGRVIRGQRRQGTRRVPPGVAGCPKWGLTSVCLAGDSDDLVDRLRLAEHAEQDVGDVGAGDGPAAPEVLPVHRAVGAGEGLVGEPGGRTTVQSKAAAGHSGWGAALAGRLPGYPRRWPRRSAGQEIEYGHRGEVVRVRGLAGGGEQGLELQVREPQSR